MTDHPNLKPEDRALIERDLVMAIVAACHQQPMTSPSAIQDVLNTPQVRSALDAARAEGRRSPGGGGERFWLILKEPGRQPELKGSWLLTSMAATLREFIAARPTAYIDVLTWGEGGPIVEHGPQALQVLDGRSMATGRKHNERTREAHAPHHAALSSPPPSGEVREASPDLLAWLADHRRLELEYGYDDEFEAMFWRVHERSGNVNDREWDLIGQGETPLAALLSAKSYLEAKSADLTA